MVREETKTERIMVEADERVIKYERKIKRLENVILKPCRREMNKEKWTETRLGKAREELYTNVGMSRWKAEGRDDNKENVVQSWRNRVLEVERREREKERRLKESVDNEEYRRWRTARMPRYLQEKKKGQKLQTIARFRL